MLIRCCKRASVSSSLNTTDEHSAYDLDGLGPDYKQRGFWLRKHWRTPTTGLAMVNPCLVIVVLQMLLYVYVLVEPWKLWGSQFHLIGNDGLK